MANPRWGTEAGSGEMAFAPEAEINVLAACLIDGEARAIAAEQLQENDFGNARHQLLFRTFAALQAADAPAEVPAAIEELRARHELEQAGGERGVCELLDVAPTAANISYYVGVLRGRTRKRREKELRASIVRELGAGAELGGVLARAGAQLQELRNSSEDDGAAFRSLAELLERPELLRPPECVVPRLAYRGRLVILAGPDKSGKSTLLAAAAARLTRGDYFLGGRVSARHHRVVLLGLEEATGDAVRRFSDLGAVAENIQLVVLAATDLLDRTRALLRGWPADLLIIDSLSEYARTVCGSTPEDGDNAGWAQVVRPLVALAREFDIAIVLLHHVRRSDGAFRGAGEIAAAADALLELSMPREGEDCNIRHLRGRGRWSVEPFAVALRDGRYELAGGDALSLDARVVLHVEQHPGCSRSELRRAVGGRATAVDAAINNLVARGALQNLGKADRLSLFTPGGQGDLEVE